MGFLDSLKEIGFGNTGPYGRMNSGATNYANYARERAGFESERGVTQALAMAAKSGHPIPFNAQVEIADKWGVPLTAVIQRAKGINQEIETTNIKKKLQAMVKSYLEDKKRDPSLVPDENYIMKKVRQFDAEDPRILGMLKDFVVKMKDEKKFVSLSPGERLMSIGNNNEVSVAAEAQFPPAKPEKPSDMLRGYREWKAKPENKGKTLAEFKTTAWEKGGTSGTSTIERAFSEWSKKPENEGKSFEFYKNNVFEPERPTGELTDNAALERLQDYAFTIDENLYPILVKDYNAFLKSEKDRSKALEKVLNTPYRRTPNGMIFKEIEFGKWMRVK